MPFRIKPDQISKPSNEVKFNCEKEEITYELEEDILKFNNKDFTPDTTQIPITNETSSSSLAPHSKKI